ncbi:MAG: hypothetical protein WCL06_09740, partial [Bacteroidota bacterium]
MSFDFTSYMENVAIKNKEIAHVPESAEKRFFRISSIVNLEEILANITNVGGTCLTVEDNLMGRLIDQNSDNYLDDQSYA